MADRQEKTVILWILCILTALTLYGPSAYAATFYVTNNNDSGSGSLRQAILNANATTAVDTIEINVPSAQVHMYPTSALPTITAPVIIDGTKQAGYTSYPLVEIDGDYAGTSASGFTFAAGAAGSTLKGLAINSFRQYGVYLDSTSNITITGCYIGPALNGLDDYGNWKSGIFISSSHNNTIGGTTAATRNVISFNSEQGIAISNSTGNVIIGNYIGVNKNGAVNTTTDTTKNAQNEWNGIYLSGSSSNRIGGTTSGEGNVISGNYNRGIYMSSSSNNTIQGNYIGTDAAGTSGMGNKWAGIEIAGGSGNLVGGTVTAARNIISGNAYDGIQLNASASNTIQGNYIGLTPAGTAAQANGISGIYVLNGSGHTIGGTAAGAGNVISGNTQYGIRISSSTSNLMQGNYIGTNAAGTAAVANGGDGIALITSATNSTIGGSSASARNVLSGNGGQGIFIDDNSSGTTVQGNYIGTNAAGTAALANASNGIYIRNASNNSVIGGTNAGEGNVLSGNSNHGIQINGSSGTTITGNLIGRNAAGTGALGNSQSGLFLHNSAINSVIGGTAAGAGNTIAHNGADGVTIISFGSTGNRILGNAIHTNTGNGIDLANDGVTVNDSGDGDAGINNLQNYPVLTSVAVTGAGTIVSGTLNSTAARSYRIEFFSNSSNDTSGYGEGQTYLGAATVTTNASGNATFSTTMSTSASAGAWISATATDLTTNDTSEFSASLQAVALNHYSISHSATGLTCQAENITITPHGSTHAALTLNNAVTITLSAAYVTGASTTGKGDWTIVTGNGTLANGTADDGSATYTFAASGESSVVLAYKNTWAQTVKLNATDGTASNTTGTPDASSNLQLVDTGFRFTSDGTSAMTVGTHIAGKPSNVGQGAQTIYLQAIKKDTNTGSCTGLFPSGTTVNIDLASQCNNPTTCISGQSVAVSKDSTTWTSIASNPNSASLSTMSYTAVPLTFGANAQAELRFKYSDVGQIALHARYNLALGTGAASSNYLYGSTNAFVVRPFSFYISNIQCATYSASGCVTTTLSPTNGIAAPGNNPGALSNKAFIQAGRNFTLNASAVAWKAVADDANGDGVVDAGVDLSSNPVTPNYGRETTNEPQYLSVAHTLVSPAGGSNGVLTAPSVSTVSGGVVPVTLAWSEVGVIKLTASQRNYLGTGIEVTGASSSDVGRFVPDHFTLRAAPVSTVTPTCAAGGFSYMGQATLGYNFTIEAQNASNGVLANYTAGYGSGMQSSVTLLAADDGYPGQDLSARLSALPAASWNSGSYAVTTTSAKFCRYGEAGCAATAIDGPYNNLRLGVRVTDLDGASLTGMNMDPANAGGVTACSATSSCKGVQLAGTTTSKMFHGRLRFSHAYGSELLPLPMAVEAQYWSGTTYVKNASDSCTALAGSYSFSGSTNTAISTTVQGTGTLSGGAGTITLTRPTPTPTSKWRVNVNTATSHLMPSTGGSATFGIYKGAPVIYTREIH